ncbi:hypothetical protein RB595_000180 [Gaeumannomyces hyphopodioides]
MATSAGNGPSGGNVTSDDGSDSTNPDPLFEIKQVPGMGKGMIARVDIPRGTTIHTEKPLMVAPLGCNDGVLIGILKALPKDKQRQFFSLSNSSHDRGKVMGIWITNWLPVVITSGVTNLEAVALTMCRINGSCLPNSLLRYDDSEATYYLKALRPIQAGEEVTITYYCRNHMAPFKDRQVFLRAQYVKCGCEACRLVGADAVVSDVRRDLISVVTEGAQFGCPLSYYDPQLRLTRCRMLICLLQAEFPAGEAAFHIIKAYNDALDTVIAHGDCARAKVFARRVVDLIPVVDGPAYVRSMIALWSMVADQPRSYPRWRECSRRWDTTLDAIPKGLSEDDFENWLWRQRL